MQKPVQATWFHQRPLTDIKLERYGSRAENFMMTDRHSEGFQQKEN